MFDLVKVFFSSTGGPEIQPLLWANANGGELIRPGDGFWGRGPLHLVGAESHVTPFPVPEGRDTSATEAQLWAVGGERWSGEFGVDEGRDAKAEDAWAEFETAESVPPNGDDGAGSLETTERVAWTIRQHFESLAFWTLSSPVRFFPF